MTTEPGDQGLFNAIDKARRYMPEIEPEGRADSDAVRSGLREATVAVDRDYFPGTIREAMIEATSEATVLGVMARQAFDEPQLDRADIEAIKEFFKWIFNGATRPR
ncbi:hypothetical protein G9E11_01935 [Arthrobacter sp. IA7]|uniref:hypothetical protein n=1 Tax=Arthrobacter ipis TaxID=2716202 RepID=UPI0016834C35|nr:hypothetical protein [Arthrobacter ipis]MBD1541034.1 hypothetical protein [Arthrobacter ipis]